MAKQASGKKKPVKVGIIGLGRAGYGMHCGELEPRGKKFTIVAGCDILKSKRDRFQERLPQAKVYATVAELIADPEVEIIDIAHRTTEHVETALLALKSGKNVFLEKPICETYEEARQIQRAAGKAKGKLYIRHNRRFESAFTHIGEVMAGGVLGEVYEIKLCRHGFSRRSDWQTLKACGGGQLNNWGPHIIDQALRFLDSPVQEIWSDLKRIAAVGDAEDHLKIVLKGKNSRIVDLEISGGVALGSPVYAVYGTLGSLISENEQTLKLRYLDPRNRLSPRKADPGDPGDSFGAPDNLKWIEKEIPVKPKCAVNLQSIWDYLYASLREGKPFPITTEQSVEVMRVIGEVKKGTKFAR
ncbi:MAG: Gfo/Idh/MocA family oxidoreductase [Planctomycetes bacterium]|nr:Gfo/Idh/MocA family oxidoreductase [Planctomycetota bacterium]